MNEDNLIKMVYEIREILVKQQTLLDEHIKRYDKDLFKIKEDIEPIKNHVNKLQGIISFIGVIAILITIFSGIFEIVKIFLT